MSDLLLNRVADQSKPKKLPQIRVGYTVKIHQKIKEGNKERIQIFEGLVIKMNSGCSSNATMTVRKVVEGVGVEKIFPLYSPLIAKIEIVKIAKIRRSKLYYMRDLTGKAARLKETWVGKDDQVMAIDEPDEVEQAEEMESAEDSAIEEKEEQAEVVQEEKVEEVKEEDSQEKSE